MRRRRLVAVAFAVSSALLLVAPSGLVAADGEDSDADGVPDETEQDTERVVVDAVAVDVLNIESTVSRGFLEDQFRISYRAGSLEMWYQTAAGSEVSYELELRRVVEWADPNQNDRIDDNEITYAQSLGTSAFGDVPISRSVQKNADGGRLLTYIVPSRAGDLELRLSVGERFSRLSNQRILTPMEVKMDLAFNYSFYRSEASLGIEMRLTTQGSVEFGQASWASLHGFATAEGTVNVSGGTPDQPAVVFFSWSKTALAGGHPIPVSLTAAGTEGTYDLYFAYPMGALGFPSRIDVLHDPSLGVQSPLAIANPAEPQGDLFLYIVSLAGVATIVASTVLVARSRQRKRDDSGRNP